MVMMDDVPHHHKFGVAVDWNTMQFISLTQGSNVSEHVIIDDDDSKQFCVTRCPAHREWMLPLGYRDCPDPCPHCDYVPLGPNGEHLD